jgi:Fe-S cluster assembly protein SufD
MRGVVFGGDDQHFDHQTLQEHIAADCSSDLLFKVVVKDQAMSVHLGIVRVHRDARGTDASQTVRNLILSEGAKAHPILPLEIEASDIRRCSHAATVGQVDENQLFYLMSRGLSRRDAQKLIVDGFFEPVLEAIPLPSIQHRLRQAVDEKLALATP